MLLRVDSIGHSFFLVFLMRQFLNFLSVNFKKKRHKVCFLAFLNAVYGFFGLDYMCFN